MLSELSEWFWQERRWFPEGLGWADLEDRDGRVYAKACDLWVALPIALIFLIIRQIFERMVATPLASLLGVKDTVRLKAPHNTTLESYYCKINKNPTQSSVASLCQKTGYSERQVQRWFRRRRNQDRPSLLKKFREASWRFTFYLLAFIAGLAALIDKPWLYDLKEMWQGFPVLTLLPSQYWYYMIELGFYGSLLFSVASDVKRKVSEFISRTQRFSLFRSTKDLNRKRRKRHLSFLPIIHQSIFCCLSSLDDRVSSLSRDIQTVCPPATSSSSSSDMTRIPHLDGAQVVSYSDGTTSTGAFQYGGVAAVL